MRVANNRRQRPLRLFQIAGTMVLTLFAAGAPAADAQQFVQMNRQVEAFLTGLWVETAAPADRPPNESEVDAAMTRCEESMLDPRRSDKELASLFPSEVASHGDISMFRADGVFVLAQRTQDGAGLRYPVLKKMTVGAFQRERIVVRFVSYAGWQNGAWTEEPGTRLLWGDALLGDLDVGGDNMHVMVLGRNNVQTTYVKCG
jgi:hypothetical protein